MSRTAAVVVNYNALLDTQRCVESLLRSWERPTLVLVDNASDTGGLEEVVAHYPGAKLIYSPANLGFGRGNNLGIKWALAHTGSEFVFLLNNDAMVEPDTIAKLENALDNHPKAGIAAPRVVLAEDPDVLWYGGGEVDWRRGSAIAPGYMGPANASLALRARDVSFASGCAILARRSVFEEVGGFDPRFFMYEEDVELSLRVQKKGWSIRYVPEALVSHRGQGALREGEAYIPEISPLNPRLPFYMFHRVKNRLVTMFVHARGLEALKFMLFFPMFLLVKSLQFAVKGRWDGIQAALLGVREGLTSLREPYVDELK